MKRNQRSALSFLAFFRFPFRKSGNGGPPPTIADYKIIVDRLLGQSIYLALVLAAIFGLISGSNRSSPELTISAISAVSGMVLALGVCGAALAVGVLAGFLFGLPRSLTSAEVREGSRLASPSEGNIENSGLNLPGQPADAIQSASKVPGYGNNSNLERISDWLTTIIVGLGLVHLQKIVPAIELFGDRAGAFFVIGGKMFAISAGLYFLITGFLLSYVNTRTKIFLIFTENDIDATKLRAAPPREAYKPMYDANPAPVPLGKSAAGDPDMSLKDSASSGRTQASAEETKKAEQLIEAEVLAQKSAIEARTPQELLAIANARALTGDYAGALSFYRDVHKWPNYTLSDDDLAKFGGIIGLNGDADLLKQLEESLKFNGQDTVIRTVVSAFEAGVLNALQANLYNGRFEDSIRLGELYFTRRANQPDAWAHLWLACAYGQKHAALLSSTDGAEKKEDLKSLCEKAADEAKTAVAEDSSLKEYVARLARPETGSPDNDLATVVECLEAKKVIDRKEK